MDESLRSDPVEFSEDMLPPVVVPGVAPTAAADERPLRLDEAGRIRDQLFCVDCGGGLRDVPATGICPSCCSAVERSIASRRQVTLAADGRLAEDIVCRECDYNLRGLLPTELCPECSTPVSRSLHSDLLQFAHPAWLKKLSRGANFVAIGIIATIGSGMLIGVVGSIIAGAPGVSGGTLALATAVMAFAAFAFALLTVYGAWLATTREPGRHEEKPVNARTVARCGIAFTLLQGPVSIVQEMVGAAPMLTPAMGGPLDVLLLAISAVLGLGVFAGYLAGILYLRKLFRRAGRDNLAGQCRVVVWGFGICYGLLLIASLLLAAMVMFLPMGGGGMAPSQAALAYLSIVGIGACATGLGTLTFTVWAVVLLFIASNIFKRAHESARDNWQRPDNAVGA